MVKNKNFYLIITALVVGLTFVAFSGVQKANAQWGEFDNSGDDYGQSWSEDGTGWYDNNSDLNWMDTDQDWNNSGFDWGQDNSDSGWYDTGYDNYAANNEYQDSHRCYGCGDDIYNYKEKRNNCKHKKRPIPEPKPFPRPEPFPMPIFTPDGKSENSNINNISIDNANNNFQNQNIGWEND
ncbi:MAG: hypothetical protein WCV59_02265 [Parcubacteria group bacterium]|jgi:hypothetical protein